MELYKVRKRCFWELLIFNKITLRKFRMDKKEEGFVNCAGILPVGIIHRILKCSTLVPVVFVFISVS